MDFRRITPAQLGQAAIGTSPTVTTIFTAPANTRDMVKCIDISNTAAVARNVTVYLVKSGDTPGAANTLLPAIRIIPKQTIQWTGLEVLNPGDSIRATASGAGCTLTASGGQAV